MLDHIGQSAGSRHHVFDDIAHDLRTPLARLTPLLRRASLAGLCGMLGACATYKTAPVMPSAIGIQRAERSLPSMASWSTASLLAQSIVWAPTIRESEANARSLAAAARAARVRLPMALQLTTEYSHDDNPDKPWLGSGVFDIPLDAGRRRTTRIGAADLATLQARYDYGEAIWTTRSAIRRALIDRAIADRLAPLAARARALRQDRYTKLQTRVDAGEEARPTSIAAQIDLATAERRMRDIAMRRTQTDVALGNALGVDGSVVAGITIEPLGAGASEPSVADLRRWRQDASAGRRDVLRAIIDYDLAENAVRQEVANQYPAMRIQPGYTYERGLVKLPFGVNLQLPPVDLNRAAIAAAEERRAVAGARLETLQSTILGEVDRSATALSAQIAVERITATRDLPVARRLAERATASLRAGEGDRVDEDAAAATAIDTEIALIEAQRLAWIAFADLEDALRRPADPREGVVLDDAMKKLGEIR